METEEFLRTKTAIDSMCSNVHGTIFNFNQTIEATSFGIFILIDIIANTRWHRRDIPIAFQFKE